MIDNKQNEYIRLFLLRLADKLANYHKSLIITQFGSSTYKEIKNGMDIDLLVLSENDYAGDSFQKDIQQLKQSLLAGKQRSSLNISNSGINDIIADECKKERENGILIIPRLTIGPINTSIVNKDLLNVFLHIKGPLTHYQFIEFCKYFPFHAGSIISNYLPIYGVFHAEKFLSEITINIDELQLWVNSLKQRVTFAMTNTQIEKVWKKLIQNVLVFINEPTSYLLTDDFMKHLIYKVDNRHLNILELKEAFYTTCDNCIEELMTNPKQMPQCLF